MHVQEHFLLTEAKLRVQEGERRARLEQALTAIRQSRPSLRERTATLLVALASKLSPEAVVDFKGDEPYLHA